MKHLIISLSLVGGLIALSTMEASAVVCARGVVRAGCIAGAATVGAAVVHTGGAAVVRAPVARRHVGVAPARRIRR